MRERNTGRQEGSINGIQEEQLLKRFHFVFPSLPVGVLVVLTGCGDGVAPAEEGPSGGNRDTSEDPDAGDDTVTDTGAGGCGPVDPELAELDAEELFAWPSVPTFDLYLPPDDWEQLQEDARDEEYVEAEACFEGRGIGTVGLRFKGSYGSLYGCFNDQNEMICRKLGIKLKFSEYDVENRFFGMKRLNFHGYRWDTTYMKEKLSYDLYRAMDIVAPRTAWAQIRVNGELMGLYGMVEQVDGRFTDNRWPENGDGNLYKELWPVSPNEEWAMDADFAAARLKTNDDAPDVAALLDFADAMRAAEVADLRSTLEGFVDLDYLARYMAVDDAIANYDGITTYWTSGEADSAGNHNFYIYEEAPDRFTLIPWDLESTLSLGGFGNLPRWTEVPEDCGLVYTIWGRDDSLAAAPGCDRIFRALAQDLTSYRAAGQALLDGPFAEEAMMTAIDEHAEFIEAAVRDDPNGAGTAEFEKNVGFLRSEIPRLRARLAQFLTGEPWTPFEIGVGEVTDLEAQDEFGLLMTAEVYASEGTTLGYEINTADPLFDERDLRITFAFAESGETWVSYKVPLAGGINDLSAYSGIRLWMRGDEEREFRIEFDSHHTSEETGWIRAGWDFTVPAEASDIELRFEDAEAPWWAESSGWELSVPVSEIQAAVNGIIFRPENGINGDEGFVDIDNIEFF